jgi:hypothetical protein
MAITAFGRLQHSNKDGTIFILLNKEAVHEVAYVSCYLTVLSNILEWQNI